MTSPEDLDPLLPSDPVRRARRDALLTEISRPALVRPERSWIRPACRRIVPSTLAAAALLAAGVGGPTAIVGTGGVRSIDVLAAAGAAATPSRGEILHVRMRMDLRQPARGRSAPPRRANGEPVPTVTGRIESWRAAEPVRTRTVWFVRLPGRPGIDHLEASYADGVRRERESWRRGVRVTRLGAAERAGYEREWAGEDRSWLQRTTASGDPVAIVRALLDGRDLREAGRSTFEGRPVRRLVGAEPAGTEIGSQDGPTTYEYLVDATTFAPVRVTTTRTLSARPTSADPELRRPRRVVDRWTFELFERLPLTADTERMLRVGGG